jgi:hypothetical protein
MYFLKDDYMFFDALCQESIRYLCVTISGACHTNFLPLKVLTGLKQYLWILN